MLKEIEIVNLSHNDFNQVPETLAKMPDLKVLNLRANPIGGLGRKLSEIKKLEVLDLSGSLKYWKLPRIYRMTDLKELTVYNYYNNDETPQQQKKLREALPKTKITFI